MVHFSHDNQILMINIVILSIAGHLRQQFALTATATSRILIAFTSVFLPYALQFIFGIGTGGRHMQLILANFIL
eukprot:4856743-Amphidinium_carterae.2